MLLTNQALPPVIRNSEITSGNNLFSILIPSWNNLPYLKLCVESIREHSAFPHQIIVHVNDGSDGTLHWVQQEPGIDYTHSKKNIGVCYALNAARSLATSDYIVFFNDDMFACPGWDKVWWEQIQAFGHEYFFLSGTAIEPSGSNASAIQEDFGTSIENFKRKELLDNFHKPVKADWFGSTWPPNIVHRNLWDLVGGYSVEFSPGLYSDPDFSAKLWHAGVREFRGMGKSRVYHFGSKSLRRVVKNKGYYQFIRKWGIAPGDFTRKFLRRGESIDQQTATPLTAATSSRLKNMWKRLNAAFR